MLERVASYLSRERKTMREIKSAMTYPMIMGFTAIVVTSLIVTFVLPRFAKIYEMRSATLPMPTKILMGISDGLLGTWMYWIPTLVAMHHCSSTMAQNIKRQKLFRLVEVTHAGHWPNV